MTFDQAQAGEIVAAELSMRAELDFWAEGRDEYVFATSLGGAVEYDRDDTIERYGRGDCFLATYPEANYPTRADHAHIHTVTLPATLVDEVADTASNSPSNAVEFLSYAPLNGDGRRWRAASRYVDDLLSDPEASRSPLIVGPAARLLAATALETFPNTAVTEPTRVDSHDSHPDTLQRAIAFIEANPDRDISIADIAQAAYVTPRGVQLAFRRHLDTTPKAYLRQVRLSHAHRELQDATPGDGLTVTAVAYRWGFSSPGRFASQHRAAYGTSPAATLRGSR